VSIVLRFRIVADIVVAVHAMFVGFVAFGMVAIVIGLLFRWRWARNFWFRVGHLAAIGFVVVQSLAGVECPLTTWERELREQGGQATYPGDFIPHWLHELIFFDAPGWVFTFAYTTFGLAVLAVFVLAPPRWTVSEGPGRNPTH
jgi:hypothetical protein